MQLQLIFYDEFNNDGRTFYPGDDPYWEATDLHYWQTGNLEWYDPAAITTQGGALKITLTKQQVHDLNYQGGMMSSWNQFCFTGGYIEVAVTLPGKSGITGLWPAIWTMGNLGRAGYGASLEGMVRILIGCGGTPLTNFPAVAVHLRYLWCRNGPEPNLSRPPRRFAITRRPAQFG